MGASVYTYEAHITFRLDGNCVEIAEQGELYGWKYSAIQGDPALDDRKTFSYLTRHEDNPTKLFTEMLFIVGELAKVGIFPLRQKIEHIVYDTKSGINTLIEPAGKEV